MEYKTCIGLFLLISTFFTKSNQQSLSLSKDDEGTTFQKLQIFFLEECVCTNLSNCQRMVEIISKVKLPISSAIKERIKRTSCGFNNSQPLICCPPEGKVITPDSVEVVSFRFGSPSDWVWPNSVGENKGYSNFHHNHITGDYHEYKNPNDIDIRKLPFDNINDNTYDKNLIMENIIDFEDKKTHKNCPPSFYDDDNKFYDNYKSFGKGHDSYPGKYYRQRMPSRLPPRLPPHKDYQNFHNHHHYPYNSRNNYWYDHGNHHRFSPTEFPSSFYPHFETQTPTTKPTSTTTFSPPIISPNSNPFNSRKCGISIGTRIIGGTTSAPGQFPWMARIAYRNLTSGTISYRCAGSFINEQYMVTAAHCVTNLVETLQISHIKLGEDSDENNSESEYQVAQLLPHPGYDTPKYANDIALIKISQTNLQVIPICLPAGDYKEVDINLTGRVGTVAGWSSNSRGDSRSNNLEMNFVRLPIVNQTDCAKIYSDFSTNFRTPIIISNSQICAQGTENMDACQGDSGGPLMLENIDGRNPKLILLGLVSFGPRTCGISNFPGVYTRISGYMDWISRSVTL